MAENKPSGGEEKHSTSEIFTDAKYVAEAARSTLGKESEKVDKAKAADSAGDLRDQQHFMNTDDAKPETPKPKVPQLVDPTVSLRPPPPPPPLQSPIRQTSIPARPGTTETKADVWEREEHRKIKERYEKSLETIDSWEKRKKMKARRKLNKHEQGESERKRAKAWRKYEDKIKYIDVIAAGARAKADDRRRNKALKAKEKANIIRTTGKLPGPCSCFQGRVRAEAARSTLGKESDKVDKAKAADSAGDLLEAGGQYAKLDDQKGVGQYVDKAADYLHQYHPTTATGTAPSSKPDQSKGDDAAAAAAQSTGEGGGGFGGVGKLAGGFFK